MGRRFTGFRPLLNNGQRNFFYNDMEPYNLVNLRTGVSFGTWRATVFVENLMDERAVLRQENISGATPATLRVSAKPRTFGITLSARY